MSDFRGGCIAFGVIRGFLSLCFRLLLSLGFGLCLGSGFLFRLLRGGCRCGLFFFLFLNRFHRLGLRETCGFRNFSRGQGGLLCAGLQGFLILLKTDGIMIVFRTYLAKKT